MVAKAVRILGAAVAGLFSIGGMFWSLTRQLDDAGFLAKTLQGQLAPLPPSVLPSGVQQPKLSPLDADEKAILSAAIWRDPFNPGLFNLLYANSIRIGRPEAEVKRQVGILAKLGWRYTPAQQNLLYHNLLNNSFVNAVDRADALLRRQKETALAFAVLSTMEATPQVQKVVIDRLRGNPKWRHDYLMTITPQSSPALLNARPATLAALSHTGIGIGQEEIGPSLVSLLATGRGRAAYALWDRRGTRQTDSNLIYDPDFQQAAVSARSDTVIPFEWRLSQDFDYSAQPSPEGVLINWNRRGVPTFLTQVVPVVPGRGYALTIRGTSDSGDLALTLAPALVCGTISVPMTRSENRNGEARYLTGMLPPACDMGTLTINGAVDSGVGIVNLNLTHIILQRIK